MQISVKKWLNIALINLCIVAFFGTVLRYKIAFSLPFIDQKHFMHGHSHFAFSGWVSQALMILFIHYLDSHNPLKLNRIYKWLLVANLLASYGMLISFPIQGYGLFSILFSNISIIVSYIFAIQFWKDLNKLNINPNAHLWFKASLLFNIISSFGTFSLAYMMSHRIMDQKLYLASVYHFLHFHYNGWFIFAIMGLLVSTINRYIVEIKQLKSIFWIFAICCPFTYFLSALWIPIPKIIYIIVVLSAFLQLAAWIWLINIIKAHISLLKKEISTLTKWLIGLAALSMTTKLILQLGSTYEPLSKLVFGFRPIVIGYLHLVLLATISIFILGYIYHEKLVVTNRTTTKGIVIFVAGVFLNEILLMLQGGSALASIRIPYINIYLFVNALVILAGTILLNCNSFANKK